MNDDILFNQIPTLDLKKDLTKLNQWLKSPPGQIVMSGIWDLVVSIILYTRYRRSGKDWRNRNVLWLIASAVYSAKSRYSIDIKKAELGMLK